MFEYHILFYSDSSDDLITFNFTYDRDEVKDAFEVTTQVPVNPIPTRDDNPLFLQGVFSNNGHGKLKQPMRAYYTLTNRTSNVFDLSIIIDSSESFMNAGPKKVEEIWN